jgi:GT2 family glycosyltransferase
MSSSGPIGVVTVTYNSGRVLDGFLSSLEEQTRHNFIVYAVDNASQDDTLIRLKAWGDARLRVIPNTRNLGVAEGNNQGTLAALADDCDLVLYLNNDVEFEPETFAVLAAELDALNCDLISPKILCEDGTHIWSAGGAFSPMKGYLGSNIGQGETDDGQFDIPKRIMNANTCCLLVRKPVFGKVGIMDANYFVYHDDADFMYRVWRAGLTAFYTPRARILHKASALTGGSKSSFSIRYNARGHVYFMLKNLGVMRCLFYLPALQLRMFVKLLTRSMSWKEYLTRQRAFFEGVAVWAS